MLDDVLTIALPKGRLQKQIAKLFEERGIPFSFEDRKLTAYSKDKKFKFFLVKNSDLPTYVNYGIAGIGFCGDDVLYESGYEFNKIAKLDFGSTQMCLAGVKGSSIPPKGQKIKVATKFTKFAADYYNNNLTPIEIIKLNGSVELAPILGLTPYIVDLVETGTTLKANNLEVLEVLKDINVYMVANPAYYKINFKKIDELVDLLV